MGLTANYSNLLGKSRIKSVSSGIKTPQRIAIVKDGRIHSQRCISCGSFEWKNRSIQPEMRKTIQHRKGCKYGD